MKVEVSEEITGFENVCSSVGSREGIESMLRLQLCNAYDRVFTKM